MDLLSKRGFLGGGLALGALAVGTTEALAQAKAEGRKLGYAIVGLGYYATQIIMPRYVDCEHSKITALVSGSLGKLTSLGAQYGPRPPMAVRS